MVHTHPADVSKTNSPGVLSTEFFSIGDITAARVHNIPISVATPGNSKISLPPSMYIYYPDIQEVHYLGKPKIFSDEYDKQKFKVEDIKKEVFDEKTKQFIKEEYKLIKMK